MTRTTRLSSRNARSIATPKRRGAAVLELSILLPLLTLLAMGTMEFGYCLYAKHVIQGAARDACRTAILRPTAHANVGQSITRSLQAAGMDKSGYVVSVTDPTTGAAIADVDSIKRGEFVSVTVSAKFGALGVRPLGMIPATKQIIGTTTMVKE